MFPHARKTAVRLAVLAAGITAAALAGTASASVGPDSNVNTYGSPFCQANAYDRVNTIPRFTVHDAAGVCIEVPSPLKAGFTIAGNDGSRHWAYPNISAGFELNHSSCPTGTDMETGQCLPVPEQIRWLDLTATEASWLSPDFKGNLSWDLYFTPSPLSSDYSQMTRGGTEVMIWAAHPGIGVGRTYAGNPVYHVRIAHRDWSVLWTAATPWHPWAYVAFVAPRTAAGTVAMHNVRFDPLLSYVIRMGLLKDSWYYQAADFGTELYSGGAGSLIGQQYSLLPPWLGRPSYKLKA